MLTFIFVCLFVFLEEGFLLDQSQFHGMRQKKIQIKLFSLTRTEINVLKYVK